MTSYSGRQPNTVYSPSTSSTTTSRCADVAIITLSFWLSYWLRGLDNTELYLPAWLTSLLLYLLIYEAISKREPKIIGEYFQDISYALVAWILTLTGLLLIAWTAKITADFSRIAVGIWTLLGCFGLVVWRLVWRSTARLHRAASDSAPAVIVGDDHHINRFASLLQSSRDFKIALAGYFSQAELGDSQQAVNDSGIPFLGCLENLVKRAENGDFSTIFVIMQPGAENAQRQLITALCDTQAAVYVVPTLHAEELIHAQWVDYCGMFLISVFETPYKGFNSWIKRMEDMLLALMVLFVMAVPMLIIAAVIKLTSPGPAVFRQKRLGIDGHEINVLKFRTMTVVEAGVKITQVVRDDPRITPIGAFLRRTSLDELPQFFNVLRGDMSVVGPRPHAVSVNQEYRKLIPGYMLRQRVRPGITGWAQIHGLRGSDSPKNMKNRVRYDLWYLTRWSLWLDLWIVVRTIPVLAGHRNAF